MRFEPSVVVSIVTALIGVLIAFGAPISPEQKEALIAFAVVMAPIIVAGGAVIRANVYSRHSVEELTGRKDP